MHFVVSDSYFSAGEIDWN